jgi:hypothetical protein
MNRFHRLVATRAADAFMSATDLAYGLSSDQNRNIIPVENLKLFCEPPPNWVSK